MNVPIEIRQDTQYGVAQMLAGLPANTVWDCNIEKTLLLIGYLTAPPRFQGLSLSNYWAWMRYWVAISQKSTDFRLRKAWGEMDPHQKTILADDFGMGFPSHYLVDQHGFEDFADTRFLIAHLLSGVVSSNGSAKKGIAKSPDFIAVDSQGFLHVLECKGTQSSRKHLGNAIAKGISQKNNLSNSTIFASCMVGGCFVPQYSKKERAEIVFADPEPDVALEGLVSLTREKLVAGIRRVSLAKALSMAGLWQAATTIFDGDVRASRPSFYRDMQRNELQFAGYELNSDGNSWERVVTQTSFEPEGNEPNRMAAFSSSYKTTIPASFLDIMREAIGGNGKVEKRVVDNWLDERLSARRTERKMSTEERGKPSAEVNEVKRAERAKPSAWSEFIDDAPFKKGYVGWTTGQGFGFAIARERFE